MNFVDASGEEGTEEEAPKPSGEEGEGREGQGEEEPEPVAEKVTLKVETAPKRVSFFSTHAKKKGGPNVWKKL